MTEIVPTACSDPETVASSGTQVEAQPARAGLRRFLALAGAAHDDRVPF